MDEITAEITKIQKDLHSSRSKLQVLETSAKKAISSDVNEIRDSLKSGDSRAEHTVTQLRSFLSQIEYVSDSGSVNMTSQVVWLRESLDVIVQDLDSAKTLAYHSIDCTKEYSYKVMDIGEDVDSSSNKLTEKFDEAAKLEKEAKSSLETSEYMLRYYQSQIQSKEEEIQAKSNESAAKRQRKAQLEVDVRTKNDQMAIAVRERRERKEQALTGAALGVFGVLAAPFTGGASLVLAAGAGGVAGYKAVRMDEFQDEINANRRSINSLNSEISTNDQEVAALEREKANLEERVDDYETEVHNRRAKHRVFQSKITEADRVKGDIGTLKSHASSTKKNVSEALPELHKIKQSLEHCSTLVKERSLEVSTSSTYLERFTAILPVVGTRMKRANDFQKQKLLLMQASDVLDQVHAQVPSLLPSTGDVRFLDVKPWDSATVSVVELGAPIPDVCYYDTD